MLFFKIFFIMGINGKDLFTFFFFYNLFLFKNLSLKKTTTVEGVLNISLKGGVCLAVIRPNPVL